MVFSMLLSGFTSTMPQPWQTAAQTCRIATPILNHIDQFDFTAMAGQARD